MHRDYNFSSQPFRAYGVRYLFASSLVLNRTFFPFQSNLPRPPSIMAPADDAGRLRPPVCPDQVIS